MKKIFNKSFYIFFTVLLTVVTVEWLLTDISDLEKITDVKVMYSGKQVYLDVHLSTPLSCGSVVKLLDIKPFLVKNITYFPTCINVGNGVRIVYNETIEI